MYPGITGCLLSAATRYSTTTDQSRHRPAGRAADMPPLGGGILAGGGLEDYSEIALTPAKPQQREFLGRNSNKGVSLSLPPPTAPLLAPPSRFAGRLVIHLHQLAGQHLHRDAQQILTLCRRRRNLLGGWLVVD